MKATNADNQREGDNFGGDEKLFASGSCQADDRKNDECKHSEMEKQGGSNDAGFIPNRRRQRRRRGKRNLRALRYTFSDEDNIEVRPRVIGRTAMAPPNTNRFLAEDYEKRSELSILEWEKAREREERERVHEGNHGESHANSAGESFDEIYESHAVAFLESLTRQELIMKCIQMERYNSDTCSQVQYLVEENSHLKRLLAENFIDYTGVGETGTATLLPNAETTNSETDNESEKSPNGFPKKRRITEDADDF